MAVGSCSSGWSRELLLRSTRHENRFRRPSQTDSLYKAARIWGKRHDQESAMFPDHERPGLRAHTLSFSSLQ